jgi:hypothetical protein
VSERAGGPTIAFLESNRRNLPRADERYGDIWMTASATHGDRVAANATAGSRADGRMPRRPVTFNRSIWEGRAPPARTEALLLGSLGWPALLAGGITEALKLCRSLRDPLLVGDHLPD